MMFQTQIRTDLQEKKLFSFSAGVDYLHLNSPFETATAYDRFAWQAQEVAVETSFEHQSSIAEASLGVKCLVQFGNIRY